MTSWSLRVGTEDLPQFIHGAGQEGGRRASPGASTGLLGGEGATLLGPASVLYLFVCLFFWGGDAGSWFFLGRQPLRFAWGEVACFRLGD